MSKRAFDLVVCVLAAPLWIPVMVLGALVLLIGQGWPVWYVSPRRVFRGEAIQVCKFRTMVRNASALVNRTNVPVNGTAFLNIAPDSPLYTRVGRLFERVQLTELPQLLHVIQGDMSLVGNRPLPEDVIAALRQRYPHAEDRFKSPAGLTGPVQLVGRDYLSDQDRLDIEIEYCRAVNSGNTLRLDLYILLCTVLHVLRIIKPMRADDVKAMLVRSQRQQNSTGVIPAAGVTEPQTVA